MSVVNVRVELRAVHPNASKDEKDRAFRAMFAAFKRQVNESNVIGIYKECSTYESKGQKRRRKRKESAYERQREKHKEFFGQS